MAARGLTYIQTYSKVETERRDKRMAKPVERINVGFSPQLMDRIRARLSQSSGTFTPITTVSEWLREAAQEKLERDEPKKE